jgi:SAM-dependent methyltransferase
VEHCIKALRSNEDICDQEFDKCFPLKYRELSEVHWTPVKIARRAAELLVVNSKTRVLDVGSGVGKFCLIGGLTTTGQFVGVEQRANLVKVANKLVNLFQIPSVHFIEGDARNLDWREFQGFYLYNPFVENLYSSDARIDQDSEYGSLRYRELVKWVQNRLHFLPVGTRIATYHGFGGDMPPGYELKAQEMGDGDYLRLWIKTHEPDLPSD